MSDEKEKVIIYWSPNSVADDEYPIDWSMMYMAPERVSKNENIFYLKTNVGVDFTYDVKLFEFKSNIENYIGGKNEGDLEGKNLVLSLNAGWLFFSEEDVSIKITNPDLNVANHLNQGRLVEGGFNISSWFRPVEAKFNLKYENKDFSFNSQDPIACIKFFTEKEIIFKRFFLTKNLMYMSNSCVRSSILFGKDYSQSDLQNLFKDTEMDKLVLSQIKKNLV